MARLTLVPWYNAKAFQRFYFFKHSSGKHVYITDVLPNNMHKHYDWQKLVMIRVLLPCGQLVQFCAALLC